MFPPVKNNLGLISLILLRIKEARSEFLSCEYCTSLKKKKKRCAIDFYTIRGEDERNVLLSGWDEEHAQNFR